MQKVGKFGELSIRTASSLEDDSMESDERFSTIDLNGGGGGGGGGGEAIFPNGNIKNIYNSNNANESNGSIYSGGTGGGAYMSNGSLNGSNGYTSFGESATNGHFNSKSGGAGGVGGVGVANGLIGANSTMFDGGGLGSLDHSYPSLGDSISHSRLNSSGGGGVGDSYLNHQNLTPVSTASMISTAGEASSKLAFKTVNTLETIKQWSKSAYKCTKQIVSEKLGKTQRTIDPELEATIEHLRDLKKKYENILGLSSSLSTYFSNLVNTQRALGDSFSELAQKSPELIEEFNANAQTQRNLARHADTLIRGINSFVSNLNTLCTKTIEDTLITIRSYEAARLEYDANRFELEQIQSNTKIETKRHEINSMEQEIARYKEKYEKLKNDVSIKMKFLDENRIKVMKKQLTLFHNSIASYFSGNQTELEASIKQLNISKNSQNGATSQPEHKFESFLEEN